MKTWWYCKPASWRNATSALALAAALLIVPAARAAAPDGLRAAARTPLPAYPADTEAVVLLDEQITTVTDRGEIRTLYRRAVKILRPGGRSYARLIVPFDRETRLASLRGWSLPPQGKEMEVKEKDAVETSYSPGTLYDNTRYKILVIPGVAGQRRRLRVRTAAPALRAPGHLVVSGRGARPAEPVRPPPSARLGV